ncbi:beta-lactamase/transpeptidase-like protein [Obba rivulosa]|uniref:Beta-lactamase/transpeptidase-like protein n=1 Tax=Obba rivulosa TaxID=1052685 RepID=A0A8E2DJ69_9APHY|nr:beta-lactamase/transpeptidase-like protein [Obba rivulosa]
MPQFELQGWGRKTEEGDGSDMTPDSLFGLASVSKAFLVTSVGLLMDDYAHGRNVTPLPPGLTQFDWHTRLAELLPEEWELVPCAEWADEKANLKDAFGHVTGMPRHDFSYRGGDLPRDIVKRMRHLNPAYELREQWSYNNMAYTHFLSSSMYIVGAHIVETYANTSYTSFVTQRIFTPLNMTSTTFWPEEAARNGKLSQSWDDHGRRIPYWFDDDLVRLKAAAGGVISSAEDMVKWLAIFLNRGVNPVNNETFIPKSAFEEMTKSYAIMQGTADRKTPELSIIGYGMGWFRQSYSGHDIIWHTGSIPGFSTQVSFLPSDGLAVVVLANAYSKQAAKSAIAYRVIEDVLDLPRKDWPVNDYSAEYTLNNYGIPQEPHVTGEDEHKAPLSLDLEAYAGTYVDPGYGTMTLCSPRSTSHYCSFVLSDFASVENLGTAPSNMSLFASWARVWSTHLRMQHRDGDAFGVVATALFPQGYGANTSAFEIWGAGDSTGRVQFVLEGVGAKRKVRGFAMTLDGEAARARKRAGAKDPEETADVYFQKVN